MSLRTIGRDGEAIAEQHLLHKGFFCIARNVYVGRAEIDLVVQKGDLLVFVEVKWRKNTAFGSAAEAITWRKRLRLRQAALRYLAERPHRGPFRIDCVLLDGPRQHLSLTHLQDVC
jgi:putative endonuclease